MDFREPILQIEDLSKKYGDTWAVKDLNLSVYRGEVYGFLGRNGAGKTTTIRMIAKLIIPTKGKIRLFGQPLEDSGQDLFRQLGFTIEYPGFYLNLTARENLIYNARSFGIQDSRIQEVLEEMGLGAAADQVVRDFSLGMKQRLSLARVLLHRPKFVILDEPTNGLDPSGIKEIRGTIKRFVSEYGMTVFVSSHILSEIEQMATRVGIIHQGRFVEEVTLSQIQHEGEQYLTLRVSHPEKAISILRHQLRLDSVDIVGKDKLRIHHYKPPEMINRILHEQGIDVSHLSLYKESLEDHFIRVTGGDRR